VHEIFRKKISEQTPEFSGARGVSMDSLRNIESIPYDNSVNRTHSKSKMTLENSLASEDPLRECRKWAKRGAVFVALMKETEAETESEVLESVMNMKYDLQTMGKTVKCFRNIQKLMIDWTNSSRFNYKEPPKPKDVWRWIRHVCEQYMKSKEKEKKIGIHMSS
jgi:hypothetical protein